MKRTLMTLMATAVMITVAAQQNPLLPGFHADPEVLYSNQTGKYYIYSTTDGMPAWGGYTYSVL